MTTTKTPTIQGEYNNGVIGNIADLNRTVKLGDMLTEIKVVVTALTATATPDITSAAVKAAGVITGSRALESGENLPPIGEVISLRVAASGTANSVGSYGVTDDGGTAVSPTAGANMGIAKLSDDGKTITFPSTVTAFTIRYRPRCPAGVTMTQEFPTRSGS